MNFESSTGLCRPEDNFLVAGTRIAPISDVEFANLPQLPEVQLYAITDNSQFKDIFPHLEIRYGDDATGKRALRLYNAFIRQLDNNDDRGKIGVTPKSITHHRVSHITLENRDFEKYEEEPISESPIGILDIKELLCEWEITTSQESVVQLKFLGDESNGWTFRLFREYAFHPPPVGDFFLDFEYPLVTDGSLRLFRLISSGETLCGDDMGKFRDWCLMTNENSVGWKIPVPNEYINSHTVLEEELEMAKELWPAFWMDHPEEGGPPDRSES
ncbi:hypothetical protein TWF694_004615 [Orbilia ellipsospora]|uniref:Uncharacterized protein n=1 Tax=Orbilia ellipsospora TaxID=2528407 RepID=A0AAV9WX31_9PEZI